MSNFRESYAHLADGRPVYYFEEGVGPPFLFVHGGTQDADTARPMVEVLRDRFHCIALDRVGYPRSGPLDRVTTLEEQVEGIAAVHSASTSDPAWVFGHSSGGNYAVAYALAYPDQVRGLILMEPALMAVFPEGNRPPAVTAMAETVVPLMRAGRVHEGAAQWIGVLNPELSPETLNERASGALSSNRRMHWEALTTDQPLVVTWAPSLSEWARLTQPALVIEGDRTWGWLRAIAVKVAQLLPHGELFTLEGLDHGAPGSAPDIVAQRAVEFIDRVSASEGSKIQNHRKEDGS
jgi:pimeloyl-ACP methyl ester carboxylesterase